MEGRTSIVHCDAKYLATRSWSHQPMDRTKVGQGQNIRLAEPSIFWQQRIIIMLKLTHLVGFKNPKSRHIACGKPLIPDKASFCSTIF
jgi:hypothetical protein